MRQDEYDDLLAGNAILQDEITKLKAENARYREALEHISKSDERLENCCQNAVKWDFLDAHYYKIAREAFKGE